MSKHLCLLLLIAVMSSPLVVNAKEQLYRQKEDKQHVRSWNRFADSLLKLHQYQLQQHNVRTTEESGGYGGLSSVPDYYREVSYYDKQSGKLLSRVQWEKDNPQVPHVIEVFVYDQHNELSRDYLVAWLPGFRNAPIQTLINLHNTSDNLRAFRQFDASGNRIYEFCEGSHFDSAVDISIEDYELSPFAPVKPAVMSSEAYTECFGILPVNAGVYLNPLSHLPLAAQKRLVHSDVISQSRQGIDLKVKQLDQEISELPRRAELYVERGDLLFKLHDFDRAIDDYNSAIQLDNTLDRAWFGRGMARGRNGQLAQGIQDLGVYIQRNPGSSLAYTKRGVRHIWNNDLASAEKDLRRALQLDITNAEAHDDLGVLLAQRKQYDQAIYHLRQTLLHDPSYQKGFHNLATVYFITGELDKALATVNESLNLDAQSRDSLLLKGEILSGLGQQQAANAIIEEAEFLPESNWSEASPVRPAGH